MKKIYIGLAMLMTSVFAFSQGDDCANAVVVTPGTYTADGPSAGAGASNNCYTSATNADWYAFTPACDGTIDVESFPGINDVDTRLSIHSGACGTLVCEAQNDDGGASFASLISGFAVTGGTTYYIEWDDRWDILGFDWELTYTSSPVAVTNIVTSNLTTSSVDVNWDPSTGGETEWTFEYGLSGFTPGTGTIWNVTVASDTSITGLLDGTDYDVYITPVPGGPCVGSEMISFTTINSCPELTGLTLDGVIDDSVFFSWTIGGLESEWYVDYGVSGFTPGSGSPFTTTTDSDTITGLMPNTFYDIYVQAVCSVGDSSAWVGPLSFNTYKLSDYTYMQTDLDCPTQGFIDISGTGTDLNLGDDDDVLIGLDFPIVFQGVLETEVTVGNNGSIQMGDTGGAPLSGSMNTLPDGLYPYLDDLDEETGAVLYEVIGTAPNRVAVFQWQDRCNYSGSITDPTITFQAQIHEGDFNVYYVYDDVIFGGPDVADDFGANADLGLSGSVDDFFLSDDDPQFLMDNSCAHFYYVTCPQPSGLDTVYVTTDSIVFSFNPGASGETEWQIEYGPAGFSPGSGTTFVTTDTQDTLGGLSPITQYDIYVTAICAVGDSSMMTGPLTQYTDPTCENPSNILVDFELNDSAGIAWTSTGSATMWNVQYGLSGFAIGSGTTQIAGTNSDTLYGLNPGQVYDVYVQSDCGSPDTSFWVGPTQIFVPITNDDICGSINLPVDGMTYSYHNNAATSTGEPGTTPNNTIWFDFVAPASGGVRIGTCGSTFDTELEVFEADSCDDAGIASVGYADGNPFTSCSGNGPAGIELCGLTPGVTYYFWVGPYFSGTFGEIPVFVEALDVNAGSGSFASVCEDNPAFDLFTTITGNNNTSGQWYINAATAGNEITSTVNVVGASGAFDFFYVDLDGCLSDTASSNVTIVPLPNVGMGSTITAGCNYGFVNLYDGLSGTVDFGGTWYDDSSTDIGGGDVEFNGEAAGSYNYYYVVDNGVCAADTATVVVDVIDCTGINENTLSLDVYPNPVSDVLYVKLDELDNNTTVQLIDIKGSVVTAPIALLTNTATIDVSDLSDGIYFVRVTNGNATKEVRIVKQ